MKKIVGLTIAVFALTAVPAAYADVSYASFLLNALDQIGAPISDGTYAMVMDLDGDGWDGQSYLSQTIQGDNASSWIWDLNDLMMDFGGIVNGQAFPFANILTGNLPPTYTPETTPGADNGDSYYLLWFNTPFDPLGSSVGPGAGVFYGVERLGSAGANPGNYTTFPNGGIATLQTVLVPEPFSAVLALIGGGAMVLRRRYNRTRV